MSWLENLSKLYDNSQNKILNFEIKDQFNHENPLLPLFYLKTNPLFQVEITLDGEGNFKEAKIVSAKDSNTMMPVTIASSTRTSQIAPHPLFDTIEYLEHNYSKYIKTSKKKEITSKHFDTYISNLKKWCDSPFSNEKVKAILKYLSKKTLMEDLINFNIFTIKNGFIAKNQEKAFIRFRVENEENEESAVWLDKNLAKNFIDYYTSSFKDTELCYATGEQVHCSNNHLGKIRENKDSTKLISGNDKENFTFRGRFEKKEEALSVGTILSNKAHLMLSWLIRQQGYIFDEGNDDGKKVIVVFGTQSQKTPSLLNDTQDIIFENNEIESFSTETEFAKKINKAIDGYSLDIDTKSNIIIMGLSTAVTGALKGRLSINYYCELNSNVFLNYIKKWHQTCSWKHSYKLKKIVTSDNEAKYSPVDFVGAPSLNEIVKVSFGNMKENLKTGKKNMEVNPKIKANIIQQLIPCVINGSKLSYNIVSGAINNISNPIIFEKNDWNKYLTITCALIKKYRYDKFGEDWSVALDENQKNRSYLFGRLLAIAQQIEERSLYLTKEKRLTNSEKLMHQFRLCPHRTWEIIMWKLKPYTKKLIKNGSFFDKEKIDLIAKVTSMFSIEDFKDNSKLDELYLLGYYSQKQVFIDQIKLAKAKKQEKILNDKNKGEI